MKGSILQDRFAGIVEENLDDNCFNKYGSSNHSAKKPRFQLRAYVFRQELHETSD